MTTRFVSAAIILLAFATIGCRKDDIQKVNCEKLQQAILSGKPESAEIEINKILSGVQSGTDNIDNFNKINEAIGSQCLLTSATVCYNCIQTNPVQSEIKIRVTADGMLKDKIIDISYSEEKKYVFAGMHDE